MMELRIMSKRKIKKIEIEQKRIAKLIFLGLSNVQMAKKLNCSLSTVAYRSSKLFEKYGVKSKKDFIIEVLGEVLETNKQSLFEVSNELDLLKEKTNTLKEIILGLLTSYNNEKYAYWLNQAKKHIS